MVMELQGGFEFRKKAPHAMASCAGAFAMLFILLSLPADPAIAQTQGGGKLPVDAGIDQRLNAQIPLDLAFRDETGGTVHLKDYFGKRPVILSLVYYDCPMLCTLSLNGLLHSLELMKLTAGQDFEVVTVSFDPREKPELAAAKKRLYLTLYNRPSAWRGWHFLTGDEVPIRLLTAAVGFRYKWDAASGQYAHATGIMVSTPLGRLARYFYGIEYPSRDLRLSLVEASANRIGSPVDQILLFCYHYDPAQGKYGLVVTRVLQLGGIVTVLFLITLVLILSKTGNAPASARSHSSYTVNKPTQGPGV